MKQHDLRLKASSPAYDKLFSHVQQQTFPFSSLLLYCDYAEKNLHVVARKESIFVVIFFIFKHRLRVVTESDKWNQISPLKLSMKVSWFLNIHSKS